MMRTVNWLFVVSVALFISGIGFVIASARTARSAGSAAPVEAAVTTTPVATVKQIMATITAPSAGVIYGSVSTTVTAAGITEIAPQNDDEWAALGSSAAVLAESANLLMADSRAIDKGDWIKFSQQLVDTSKLALKAANEKSIDGILEAGGPINDTCESCHAKYAR